MMPRLSILLLALLMALLMSAPAGAQGVNLAVQHFDEGNIRYREGDYRGAVNSYERAVAQGFESGALYFNMANAYYRLDEIGQSIRYYEKAAELIPGRPELEHNMQFVREQTIDQFSRLPDPFWRPWWRFTTNLLGSTGLFILGILFYFAATTVIAIRLRRGQTPWRRRILTASLAFAVLFLAAGFTASAEELTARRAVVLIDAVNLLESPDGARSDLDIHEGLVVDVVANNGEWMEVRLPNGATGWIRSEALGVI